MVNVAHDCNNRRTFNHVFKVEVIFIYEEAFDISFVNLNFFMSFNTIISHQQFDCIAVEGLVLCCHNTHHEQFLNNFSWFAFNTFCDFSDCHTFSIFKFFRQFMELTLCYRFCSSITIIFTFFVFLIIIPVTISLISHLVLIIPVFSIFILARSVFMLMIVIM